MLEIACLFVSKADSFTSIYAIMEPIAALIGGPKWSMKTIANNPFVFTGEPVSSEKDVLFEVVSRLCPGGHLFPWWGPLPAGHKPPAFAPESILTQCLNVENEAAKFLCGDHAVSIIRNATNFIVPPRLRTIPGKPASHVEDIVKEAPELRFRLKSRTATIDAIETATGMHVAFVRSDEVGLFSTESREAVLARCTDLEELPSSSSSSNIRKRRQDETRPAPSFRGRGGRGGGRGRGRGFKQQRYGT